VKIRHFFLKTEFGLFLLTLLFAAFLLLFVFHNDKRGERADYYITPQIAAENVTPEKEGPININTATAEELTQLEGIGEVIAGRIVDYRSEHGKFASIEDLMQVKGIGESTLNELRDQITAEEEP